MMCIEDSRADSLMLHGILRIITQRALLFVPGTKEAIAALAKLNQPPVVILCDLVMPDNGQISIDFIRKNYPQTPIVVISGSTDADRVAAMEGGATEFIQKSDRRGLSNALHEALAKLQVV